MVNCKACEGSVQLMLSWFIQFICKGYIINSCQCTDSAFDIQAFLSVYDVRIAIMMVFHCFILTTSITVFYEVYEPVYWHLKFEADFNVFLVKCDHKK